MLKSLIHVGNNYGYQCRRPKTVITADFTGSAGWILKQLPPMQLSDTISVPIVSDNVAELHETFTLTLSSPTGATLLVTSVQGTILNDDGIKFSIADGTLPEGAMDATDNEYGVYNYGK